MTIYKQSRLKLLMIKHDSKCAYCGVHVVAYPHVVGSTPKPNTATKDHIIPRSQGGTNSEDNITLACWKCNNQKGQMNKQEFVSWLACRDKTAPVWTHTKEGDEVADMPSIRQNQNQERSDLQHPVTDRGLVSWLKNKHGIDTDRLKDLVLKQGLVDGINTQENFIKGSDGYTYCIKMGKVNYVSAPSDKAKTV